MPRCSKCKVYSPPSVDLISFHKMHFWRNVFENSFSNEDNLFLLICVHELIVRVSEKKG